MPIYFAGAYNKTVIIILVGKQWFLLHFITGFTFCFIESVKGETLYYKTVAMDDS